MTIEPRAHMTISEAATALGLPGPWTLRRLEQRGVLPIASRSTLSGERYYHVSDLRDLRERIDAFKRGGTT